MDELDLSNWLQLAFSYGVGPATLLKLIAYFGSAENVLAQNLTSLSCIVEKGVALSILSRKSQALVEQTLEWQAAAPKRRMMLTLASELYPLELAEIAAPPLFLFAEGNFELLQQAKIAIVGTRNPSAQGLENGRNFARELAANGFTVVSGLAAGIDRAAHEGALAEMASTIGVLGTGIDQIYPASNRELFQRISQQGLILSEFQLGTNPLSNNFPRRNRIIVGLSQACLVIESGRDGGSMISANFALEMGREVMAIPGSIHNPMARGCHKLIKQGAKLVETATDVLEDLRLNLKNPALIAAVAESPKSDPLLSAMGFDPITLDVLNAKLNFDFGELCGKLLELELSGQINNCGGGRYQRIFNKR